MGRNTESVALRILTVCSGNVCRSPQAERLLRAAFDSMLPEAQRPLIESAGTRALLGWPMPEQAAALTREFGADAAGHRARQLTAEMVAASDLVIVMAREHLDRIAALDPAAASRTFTLQELARIADAVRGDDLRSWLVDARSHHDVRDDDDIEDPFRRSDAAYRRSAEQIAANVAVVARAIAAAMEGSGDVGD